MQTTIGDRRIGYDSCGTGAPLLFFNAFPLDRGMYREQNEGLADIARIITFDAPGVGNSEPGSISMDSLADLGAGLLDTLRIDRAVIGGVSMGGYASMAFARRYPDRMSGLILANTKAAADSEQALEGRRAMIDLVEREGAAAVAEQMLPKVLSDNARRKNRKLADRVRSIISGISPEAITHLIEAMMGRPDSTESLREINVPTLVLSAELDPITTPEETRTWAPEIPQSELVEIPNTGHLSNMEAPDAFNQAVRAFLERISG